MAKVLKITKSDKTIHTAPLANKNFYLSYNRRLKADKKWKIEEIDEKDAKDLPYKDKDHLTGAEAAVKVKDLQKENAEKDDEIERLKAKLAEKDAPPAPPAAPVPTAKEVIELVNAATSVEQVENLVKGDERKSVIEAAEKKKAALKA